VIDLWALLMLLFTSCSCFAEVFRLSAFVTF
jgi:hypothetical protein